MSQSLQTAVSPRWWGHTAGPGRADAPLASPPAIALPPP